LKYEPVRTLGTLFICLQAERNHWRHPRCQAQQNRLRDWNRGQDACCLYFWTLNFRPREKHLRHKCWGRLFIFHALLQHIACLLASVRFIEPKRPPFLTLTVVIWCTICFFFALPVVIRLLLLALSYLVTTCLALSVPLTFSLQWRGMLNQLAISQGARQDKLRAFELGLRTASGFAWVSNCHPVPVFAACSWRPSIPCKQSNDLRWAHPTSFHCLKWATHLTHTHASFACLLLLCRSTSSGVASLAFITEQQGSFSGTRGIGEESLVGTAHADDDKLQDCKSCTHPRLVLYNFIFSSHK